MINLRSYQSDCLRTVIQNRRKGVARQLVCLPTGTGKTVIFAYLIKMMQSKALILVHRDELLNQAQDKLLTVWPEAKIGVVKAQRNELHYSVTIASVQTLSRKSRLRQVESMNYKLIVTDEAHHAVANSYKRIYDSLLKEGQRQLHLGVTATVNRSDKVGLGKVYQKIVYHRTLLEMIREGWLCDLRCIKVTTGVSLGSVRTRAGDFATNELADVVNTTNRNELIVEAYEKHAGECLTLCFTVNVQHAHDLAEAFQKAGVKAIALSGKTPLEERRETLRKFHKREIDVICNCQLLTEGFDEPAIDCIILARPTKSNMLYIQMIGRGTRSFPNKKDCIILDVADNSGRHRVVQLPDLVGLKREHKMDGKKTLMEFVAGERKIEATTLYGRGIITSDVDLFAGSDLVWISADDRYILNLADQGRIYISPTKHRSDRYAVIHRSKDGQSQFLTPKPIDINWALGIADAAAAKIMKGKTILIRKDAEWRIRPASKSQMDILKKFNVPYDRMAITKGQASDIISQLFAKKSPKGIVKEIEQQKEQSDDLVDMMMKGRKL